MHRAARVLESFDRQRACSACPANWTTPVEGATQSSQCTCKEGFDKDDGLCISCMANAVCPGADFQPHSSPGHWSPDARTFWSCFPSDSCLAGSTTSTNECAAGRVRMVFDVCHVQRTIT